MTPDQRAKRLHHHMYETCEGIREHAERIVALEELVLDFSKCAMHSIGDTCGSYCPFWNEDAFECSLHLFDRMRELGIGAG